VCQGKRREGSRWRKTVDTVCIMTRLMTVHDMIVVGGGHAGIEAALAGARLGAKVALVTMERKMIGHMSCNPAVGGLAKGHLVLEIDGLGGQIGRLADATAIQYRMLNVGKGPAVWSPRTQNDRMAYQAEAQRVIDQTANVEIVEAEADEIVVDSSRIVGVRLTGGQELCGRTVILTTGTFLEGLIHIGLESRGGGRWDEKEAAGISGSLRRAGLLLGRFKTGTSPRISGRTVDFGRLKIQLGDESPFPFSFRTVRVTAEQLPCYITATNERTHAIIAGNLDRSPLYTGKIRGIGPRYCPSIEDKIHRFKDRPGHLVFLEPEGRTTDEYYINGLSTSLPVEVQKEMVHSIEGLQEAVVLRPGYAVEYDFVYPTQLEHSLETKAVDGLFLAGQINGTSGYEEAAAQGFMAGVNAVMKVRGEEPLILKRSEAYLGVLIDDLVLKGTEEPYRMFTSLAEHRLLLRIDNVLERLMPYGRRLGLISEAEFQEQQKKWQTVDAEISRLGRTRLAPAKINPVLVELGETPVTESVLLETVLKRPKVRYEDVQRMDGAAGLSGRELRQKVEIRIKYEGYIRRDEELARRLMEMEEKRIPPGFDFTLVPGLSNEAKTKLCRVRPRTLAQVSRMSGITPSDLVVLFYHIEKGRDYA